MKTFTRFALLLVFIMALAVPAVAQDECYGLSADDCALFTNIGPAEPMDLAMNISFAMSVTGEEPLDVTMNGAGSISFFADAEDPLKSFSMQMAGTGGDGMESNDFEFRIIDGIFYMPDPETGEWRYVALQSLIDSMGMPMDMTDMMSGNMGDMTSGMEELGALGETLKSYYSVARGADMEIAGTSVATFSASFDLPGFLADPALMTGVTEMLKANPAALGAMGMGGEGEMTEEELEEAAQTMGMGIMMLSMIFKDMELAYDIYVDPATSYFHGFDLNFAMNVDPSMMGGDSDAEPIDVSLNLNVEFSDYGGTFEYVVPEGATEVPAEELGGMGNMGM
jgi:hypothetical protein